MDYKGIVDSTDYSKDSLSVDGSSSGTGSDAFAASAASNEPLLLLPESKVAGVEVVRLLGCGRVSESWFAVDHENHQEVVLKVLRRPWNESSTAVELFRKALSGLSHFNHPNIARVLSHGMDGPNLYWTTEWIKGGSVGPKVRRKGPMDLETGFSIITQAVNGLAHGLAAHVAHGGLKPENLLMERSGQVKVSDLGIEYVARKLVSVAPGTASLWQTEWMAPEVRKGHVPDHRSDIYSLGAILHFLLSGALPQQPPDSRSVRLKPAARALLHGMLEQDPAMRISSYEQLLAEITECQSSEDTEPDPGRFMETADTVYSTQYELVETASRSKSDVIIPDPPQDAPMNTGTPPQGMGSYTPSTTPSALGPTGHASPQAAANTGSNRKLLLLGIPALLLAGTVGYMMRPGSQANAPAAPAGTPATAETAPVASAPTPLPVAQPLVPVATETAAPVPAVATAPEPADGIPTLPIGPASPPAAVGETAAPAALQTGPAPGPYDGSPIVVDEDTPGAVEFLPAGAWRESAETRSSYANASMVAPAAGEPKTASFNVTVSVAGRYELYMWWVARSSEVRSRAVPAIVSTADGPVRITLDQVNSDSDFNLVGTFNLAAGLNQPLVKVTTEGILVDGENVHVSIDALKLVPVGR